MTEDKSRVRLFWNSNPCDGQWENTGRYLESLYEKEPWLAGFFRNDLIAGKTVLDLGCGQGAGVYICATKNCKRVVGVDLSDRSVELAREMIKGSRLDNATVLVGDAESLTLDDDTFDTVFSSGVLHHTPNIGQSLSEIHRVLKKGGTAMIMLYRKHSMKGMAARGLRSLSRLIDAAMREENFIYHRLHRRAHAGKNPTLGTALLELFGCPIMNMYSKNELKTLFASFTRAHIRCCSTGFVQIINRLFKKSLLGSELRKLDRKLEKILGFYWIVEAVK